MQVPGGNRAYAKALKSATLLSGAFFLPVVAGFALVLPVLLELLYGEAYLPAVPLAWVLLVGIAAQGFNVSRDALYFFHGKLGRYNLRNVAILGGWLCVAFLLVRSHQAMGAALALALGSCAVQLADGVAMAVLLRSLGRSELMDSRS